MIRLTTTAEEAGFARLLAHYRAANPQARATSLIVQRGGATSRHYACVWCGECGPSFSGKWRETKRSIAWRTAHLETHLDTEAELVAFDARQEGR